MPQSWCMASFPSCSLLPELIHAPLNLLAEGILDPARPRNSTRDLPDSLRGDFQLPGDCTVRAIKGRSIGDLRRDGLVVTLVQVETPEYETETSTAFIQRQEGFSVHDRDKQLALIAQAIRRVRNELKLTQVEFSERLGQSQTAISKWEKAKARPVPEALIRLASMASGVDKLFFLEHAGLPEQYLMGKPMIPEIQEASDRVVGSVMGGQRRAPAPSPQAQRSKTSDDPEAVPWDREVMAFAIETVDAELKKRGRKLSIHKYAQMIIVFYELCHETKSRDPEMVARLLKIA